MWSNVFTANITLFFIKSRGKSLDMSIEIIKVISNFFT